MKQRVCSVFFAALLIPAAFGQGKKTVDFWYLWAGTEGQMIEQSVSDFNASQKAFEVKGLSVPDMQKVLVAIASGNGPDVTDDFSANVASYASKGILQDLGSYISKSKYDIKDFMPATITACSYNGKVYAMPMSANFMMLFYNKKLFAAAGIKNPPKTDTELLEDAIKLTKVNADGSIDTLGFPDFPIVYYLNDMTTAFGGDFISADGKTLTPDNEGALRALKLIVSYRQKFGVENVVKFESTGGYLSPTDPFVIGKQAMRIDGSWFGHTVKEVLGVKDLDYGVAPLPYPDGKPQLARSSLVNASVFYIPSNAKCKDGAWAFLSWFMGRKAMVDVTSRMGGTPARISALGDKAYAKVLDFPAFATQAKSKNLKTFPAFSAQAEYTKIISDQAELAMNLKKTPEEALAEAKAQSADLLNQ